MAVTGTKRNTKSRRRTGRILLPLVAVALLVAVLSALRRPEGSGTPEKTVVVNDGVNQISIIPAEGVAISDLSEEDFVSDGDVVRYVGSAHTSRQGVDVSEHQGEIDWAAAAADGIDFAVIRVGFRGSTEGRLYEDARFEENLRGAREAGLDVGVYFFSQALDEAEAVAEADLALELLAGRGLDLPVFFDWEPAEEADARSAEMDGETLTSCAAAFCRRIEEGGCRAGIYFNRQQGYHDYDLPALKSWTFWLSDPNGSTDFYYAADIWQYQFFGHVDGIPGNADRDILLD